MTLQKCVTSGWPSHMGSDFGAVATMVAGKQRLVLPLSGTGFGSIWQELCCSAARGAWYAKVMQIGMCVSMSFAP